MCTCLKGCLAGFPTSSLAKTSQCYPTLPRSLRFTISSKKLILATCAFFVSHSCVGHHSNGLQSANPSKHPHHRHYVYSSFAPNLQRSASSRISRLTLVRRAT
ncbi:unnamed protein product [Cyclocybe aegerita]|uniref:Uncharacterized protein n=1 Tax=Cyclocybe aegerita TaxID=1973307 RepID=A0A8S0VSJ1_CYCAE|nr:unnamed protein product [Cyclocybe aegerita]